jgi:hypothetical protein
MISRSTLVGALVVVELVIVGAGARAIAGGSSGPMVAEAPFSFGTGSHERVFSRAPVDRTFATGIAPRVVIDVHDVDVFVRGENVPTVHVAESLRKSGYVWGEVAPLTAQQSPDGIRISTPANSGVHMVFGSYSRELAVTVPVGTHVEFASAGVVDASGLREKLIAHVPDGAIRIRDHRGDVDVSTGSGRITMVDVQGDDIAANTRDGRIYLTRVGADRIDATSSSGRIVGVDVRAVNGALTTRDGRVILSFTGNSDATVNVHTADGNVHVSGLSTTQNDEQKSVVHLGSGRGRFEVSTGSGSITLTQGANV